MKRIRTHAGLVLIGLGVVYLIGAAPGLAPWLWALLGAALYFTLATLAGVVEAVGYGAFFLGWSLGALASDVTGLQSLKLVGTGSGLLLWGWLESSEAGTWLGAALLAAGVLVFVWESSLGVWAALALLALGLYLLLRRPPEKAAEPEPAQREDVYRALLRWREQEAARRGIVNVAVLADAELACLAGLPPGAGADEIAACLGGDLARARAVYEYLQGLRES